MLEHFIPGFKPEGETQQNISYALKLYQAGRLTDSLADRLFKSRREELEESLLERQLEAMGDNPDTRAFNAAVMAQRGAPSVPGFLNEMLGRSPSTKKPGFSVAEALKTSGHNVDFRLVMNRDLAKRALLKAL